MDFDEDAEEEIAALAKAKTVSPADLAQLLEAMREKIEDLEGDLSHAQYEISSLQERIRRLEDAGR